MTNKNNGRICAWAAAMTLLASGSALASMGNLGTSYGVLPTDVATAQALSLFNGQMSSLYYNPAAIVRSPQGGLTVGMMHAENNLELDGHTLGNTPSQQMLLGMKTDLSSLTKYHHPVYLGVMLGIEKFGKEMLAFDSTTTNNAQYFEDGREPLFLVLGGGTQLWRGIDVGLSARVTLHAAAKLNTASTLGGKTSGEQLKVSATPEIRPIAGINIDWGETLCPDSGCWVDGLETAFAYRGYSNTKTTVDSNVTIPGTVPSPGVALAVTTLDSYQPNIYSAGLLYGQKNSYQVGVTLEWQQWSKLADELKHDSVKDQAVDPSLVGSTAAALEFKDIWVPRIGGKFWLTDNIQLSSGVAYRQTPLDSASSLGINYLDSDKIIVGLGLSMVFDQPPVLAYPLRLDVGYQHQWLQEKNFDLYAGKASTPYATAKSGGSVDVVSASLSLQF